MVLQGPPGQEKMAFALTFLAEGLRTGGSGVIVTASQSPDSLVKELRRLGVDVDLVTKENRLRIVDWFSWSEETVTDIEETGIVVRTSVDLTNAGVAVSRAIAALQGNGPRRAVVEMLSPAMNVYEVGQVYAFAQSTKRKFDRFRITALFLLEKEMHEASVLTHLHQPFDGVIEIERTRSGDRIVRKVGVLHLKDTTPISDFVPFEYTDRGIEVGPKTPTLPLPPSDKERAAATPKPPVPAPAPPRVPPPEPAAPSTEGFAPPEGRAGRLRIIQGIARERLKIDSEDRDALFTLAAAQAVLEDPRGAVQTLQRLETIDPSYPGLYALEMKLFARLGDAEGWQRSRQKALESSLESEGAGPSPCPFCKEAVPLGAVQCPHCMADLREEKDLFRGLEDLVRATVQEIVQEEFEAKPPEPIPAAAGAKGTTPCPLCHSPVPEGAGQCPECKADLRDASDLLRSLEDLVKETLGEEAGAKAAEAPAAAPEIARPRGEPKPPAREKGLTNGLILERRPSRSAPTEKAGRTNGLKGRTNGLRGRTNGLTNGLRGRTNGLTNGLRGRTNGLTNGLRGRTNGLTNGLGRTNGLTNGLRGRTNGLTNGLRGRTNGLTNGLGRTNGLTNGLGRTNGLTNGVGRTNGLTNGLSKVATSRGLFGRGGRARIQRLGLVAALVVLLILLPLVLFWTGPTTTYPIRIDGQFGDWAGVAKMAAAPPQVARNPDIEITRVAVKDNLDFLAFYIQVAGNASSGGPAPTRITNAYFAFIDTDRSRSTGYQVQGIGADWMVQINTWGGRIVATAESSFNPSHGPADWHGWVTSGSVDAAVSGNQMEFELPWVDLASPHGTVGVAFATRSWDGQSDSADVVATSSDPYLVVSQDTAAPQVINGSAATLASVTLHAVDGSMAVNAINVTFVGTFGPASLSAVDLFDAAGNLLSERPVASVVQFALSPLVLSNNQTETLSVRPKVSSTDATTIGAFVKSVQDVFVSTGGVAFLGPVSVPVSLAYVGAAPPGPVVDGAFGEWRNVTRAPTGNVQPIWDRDVDLASYEFKGSNRSAFFMASVVGTALNGTMIPALNAAYVPSGGGGGGSNGTLAPPPPPVNGTDFVRFYLDVDGTASTGYHIGGIGADYLVEITGKQGLIQSAEASRFSGGNPWEWNWTRIGSAPAAKDLSHIEAALPGVAVTNASRGFFEVSGWNNAYDASASAVQAVLGDPTIVTSAGTVKWSIGDSTWKAAPTLPAAPAGPQTTGWHSVAVLANNNTFAIATDSTTYKLLSSGTAWTLFLGPPTAPPDRPGTDVVSVVSDNSNTYYAITQGKIATPATHNEVYRYTGTTAGNWPTPVTSTIGPVIIVAMRYVSGTGSSATLYYLPQSIATQLSRSLDGGTTWAAFGTAPPASGAPLNVDFTVDANGAISVLLSNGTVERSTNAASSWTWIPRSGTNQPSSGWAGIANDADGNLWTITDKYVWGYSLATKAWTNMTGGLSITGLATIDAMVQSANANIITTGGSAKWSGGGSWIGLPALPAPNTAPEGGAGSWTDIITTGSNDTYAIETDTTVYKLASGASAWSLFLSPTGTPNGPNSNGIALATDGAGTFYAITRGQAAPKKDNQVYRYTGSSPGTWSFVHTIAQANIADLEYVSGSGSTATLYYLPQAVGVQLSQSTDGGNTWVALGTAPPASGSGILNVGFTVATGGAISLLLNNGTVERSTNAASTWTWIPKSSMSPSGNVWVDIAADASGNLWAVTSSTIWKYDVTQQTWTNMTGTLTISGLNAISLRIPEFGDLLIPVATVPILVIVFRGWARRRRRAETS